MAFTNILAFPEVVGLKPVFTITNEKGEYTLKLQKNSSYQVQISHLGFKKINETFKLSENTSKDFILFEDVNALDEVEISYKIPIQVKEDTIIYNVDAFTTGKERKLKDVLKRLPGLDVDNEGNVTFSGKKITMALVENKPFFTGNSKLAVNNIPADVVSEIEVLDNYNEVSLLSGLQDSEDIAINIKLKKDKEKFLFGDLEIGGGIKNRYSIHPNLFYYSPRTSINFIGDLNNSGTSSFTLNDYLEFEGGFGKLLSNSGSYFSLFTDDFAQFLNNKNFRDKTQKFGAINIRKEISNVADINAYVITSSSELETEVSEINNYQNKDFPLTENRNLIKKLDNFFTLGNISVTYKPSKLEDLTYNTFFKLTQNASTGVINTASRVIDNEISTDNELSGINLKNNINYSRKLSEKHTGTLEASYQYYGNKLNNNWKTEMPILSGLIPLFESINYNILQSKSATTNSFNAILKDYWSLSNFSHLYFSLGANTTFNRFENEDIQILDDGTINNFSTEGFGNDIKYNMLDVYSGIEYRLKIGNINIKPAIYWHNYNWSINQNGIKTTKSKYLLLPELTTELNLLTNTKVNLKYKSNVRFGSIDQLTDNFMLIDFNSVYKGNKNLENELYHTFLMRFSKYSLFRGIGINASINYNKKVNSFKSDIQIQGIDQFSSPILLDLPENSWILSGRFSKRINKINSKIQVNFNSFNFFQVVNGSTSRNNSKQAKGIIGIETLFENAPNFEIEYSKQINNYTSNLSETTFNKDIFNVYFDFGIAKNFVLKTEYNYNKYLVKPTNTKTTFDIAGISLFYQKEGNPWGFEVKATNIFDTNFIQENTFNTFIITDRKTFIMPRIFMLNISHKF